MSVPPVVSGLAEVAYYTAGAMINGFNTPVGSRKASVVGEVGPTVMLWSPNGTRKVELALKPGLDLIQADVVGGPKGYKVPASGKVTVEVGTSPIYVLDQAEFYQLTRR